MNIAIIGCGYVAEFYAATLANYPQLTLLGAFDRDAARLETFTARTGCAAFGTLEQLLADSRVAMVVNLTNPRSHFTINRAALQAGKHVYSEKPIAMTTAEAGELAALAETHALSIGAAPCSVLSETAQTLWKAVRDGSIGTVRVAYASFDDGMIAPRQQPWQWQNDSGVAWPARDEFEVGCTYQHGGYVLTWLAAMFGPAVRLSAFASCQIPDKGIAVDRMAPDFTVGGIEYASGVAARVTCGLVAPRDKSITLVGDEGVLYVGNVRDDAAPVMVRGSNDTSVSSRLLGRAGPLRRWLTDRWPASVLDMLAARKVPLVRPRTGLTARVGKPVDFCRGIAELADAITERRRSRLPADFAVHLVETIERLQHPERFPGDDRLRTTFEPLAPMPWAM